MSDDNKVLRSKVAALEQLLEVFEHTTIEQAQRLEQMMKENALTSRKLLDAERERAEWAIERTRAMEKEVEIARQIQMSILPRAVQIDGLEIAARMTTAERVGGDYYDVIPVEDGAWLGIGDVSGHGLNAGLVMLMTQSVASSLARSDSSSPADVVSSLNAVLFDNIRQRLLQHEHVTLTLLRYQRDGKVTFAGAHEEILVCRANGACERIATPGTWVGVLPSIREHTRDTTLQLHPGDVMLLHTDGVTEAMNEQREQFGVERLSDLLVLLRRESPLDITNQILASLDAWTSNKADDATLVVARFDGTN
jgi:sigma-B regulation protein RsbU (phosphoserine phosphatase)